LKLPNEEMKSMANGIKDSQFKGRDCNSLPTQGFMNLGVRNLNKGLINFVV